MSNAAPNACAAFVSTYVDELKACLDAMAASDVVRLIACLEDAYAADRQIFVIGNGGSASTASHMACDLAKNLYPPAADPPVRRLRVTSLTDNVALITALANDCGYDRVFAEQLRNFVQPGDLVIAISASGNSPNVLEALALARARGAVTAALLGFGGGRARDMVDVALVAASNDYGQVENLHLVVNHLIAAWMRKRLAGPAA
jgi:D-sedoheptulose 7-phosphate isomerase